MPRRTRAPMAALAVLLGAPALAEAQHVPASPPPERELGPDTTSIGVFAGAGLPAAGPTCEAGGSRATPLTCDSPADPATAITCEGFLPSFDGTMLETTVRVPREPGLHPLVVGMHGWGGSRGSMAKYDARLLAEGYVVLRYSARGFGGSFGQTNLADVDVEALDLRTVVGQVVDDPCLAANPGAVAVFGASYGGAHAWLAALAPRFPSPAGNEVVVRTVIPIAGWSDLLEALAPNGRPERAHEVAGAQKLSYMEALFVGGFRTRLDRPYPNYPEYFFRWNADLLGNELPYDATPSGSAMVDGLQGYRSIYWQDVVWQRVRAAAAARQPQLPILAVQGFTDDLFPPREALRMYDALREIDPSYPIALYLGDLGHPRAANKAEEVAYALDQVVAWLGWYLKGSGAAPAIDVQAAITRAADAPFEPADVIRVASYADLPNATVTARFRTLRVITFDPANLSGFEWDPLVLAACAELEPCPAPPDALEVPGDVASYDVPVSRFSQGPLLVAGEPSVGLWILTLAPRIQLDVRVLDVSPDGSRRLVTRGTYTVDSGALTEPIGFARVRVRTHGNLWEVPADHALRFEVTNVDSPYLRPSLVASASLVGGVEVTVPVRR